MRGKLLRNIDGELLKKKLIEVQGKGSEKKEKRRFRISRTVSRSKTSVGKEK